MLQQSLIAIKVLRSWDATLQTLWLPSKLAGLVPLLGSCQAADLRAASSLPPANTGPNNAKGPDQTTSSNQTPGIHRFCPPAATSMATRGLNASSRVHHIRSPDPNSLMPAPSSAAATSPADTDSASRVSSSCSTPPCETVGAHACSSAAAASPASTDSTSSISSSCTRSPHETVGPHAFSSAAAPSLASAAPKGLLSLHHSTSPSHHAGIHAARLGTASLGPATSPASTGFNALSSLHAGVQQQAQRRVASSASTQAASSSTAVRQGTLPKAGPVAVAISGGVDSAVAALLLKQAG